MLEEEDDFDFVDATEATGRAEARDLRAKQVFHITLRNQLVPGKRGGHILADPNGFVYSLDSRYKDRQYYRCLNPSCHGRCKVQKEKELTITQAHFYLCEPNWVDIEVRRFKKELQNKSMQDKLTAYTMIYNRTALLYPDAAELWPFEKCAQLMYMARRSVTHKRLPKTLEELDLWMKDMEYSQAYAYDSMTPPNLFFMGTHKTSDGRQFAAFRSHGVVEAATGGRITIEIDGTFSVVPSRDNSLQKKFDDCNELLMIHYRYRNRNYPLGYFLVSDKITNIMACDMLGMVMSWLGSTTTVICIITDYEKSLRFAARTICPTARIVGCAVHFQRAVANWCYKHGVMSTHKTVVNLRAMRLAMSLCYLPDGFFRMGVEVIQGDVGGTEFGRKLVKYLLDTWADQSVSVFGERKRSINGCETFHWRIQRMHDQVHNNINQFIERLRFIESMCSLSVTQFHRCGLSKTQQIVERRHRDMEANFELECGREPDAERIRRFLDSSVYFSDNIYNHYLACGKNKVKKPTGQELLIAKQLNESYSVKSDRKIRKYYTITLTPRLPKYIQRSVTTKPETELPVDRVRAHFQANAKNFRINDRTVCENHASLWLTKDGIVEVRDNGSQTGTFLNGRRLSYSGVRSPCFRLKNDDELTFGSVAFVVQIVRVPTANEPIAPIVESTAITLKCNSGDSIPERNVRLCKNVPTVVGRATKTKPATRTNALYSLQQMSAVTALLNWTGTDFNIKAMGPTYRTWVNGTLLPQNTQLPVKHHDELIFGANDTTDHVKMTFLVDDLPAEQSSPDAVRLTLLMASGRSSKSKTIDLVDNARIVLGRHEPDYVGASHEVMFRNQIVSRDHAELTCTNGIIFLRDNQSTNGTYLNSKLLKAHTYVPLNNGDTVQLGAADSASNLLPVTIQVFTGNHNRPIAKQRRKLVVYRAQPISLSLPTDYITLSADTRVLLGSFNLDTIRPTDDSDDIRFNVRNQWLTVAVAAVAKNTNTSVGNWNGTVMDEVLRHGDQLYDKVVQEMHKIGRLPPANGALEVKDLLVLTNRFYLFGEMFADGLTYEPYVEGQVNGDDSQELPIKDALREFFADHAVGLLSVYHQCFAVIFNQNKFYLLHPGTNYYSRSKSCLFEANNLPDFMTIVRRVVGTKNTWYSIHAVQIERGNDDHSSNEDSENLSDVDSDYLESHLQQYMDYDTIDSNHDNALIVDSENLSDVESDYLESQLQQYMDYDSNHDNALIVDSENLSDVDSDYLQSQLQQYMDYDTIDSEME